jgi:hypothetical protein
MTSARKLAALERDLQFLEAEYTVLLMDALTACARGTWGLFGTNDAIVSGNTMLAHRLRSDDAIELLARGNEIANARRRLGIVSEFEPHAMLVRYRHTARDSNSPGEPELAEAMRRELKGAE